MRACLRFSLDELFFAQLEAWSLWPKSSGVRSGRVPKEGSRGSAAGDTWARPMNKIMPRFLAVLGKPQENRDFGGFGGSRKKDTPMFGWSLGISQFAHDARS